MFMTAKEFDYQLVNMEDRLFRFARRLTQNSDDAKDLVQETMLKAIHNKEQFSDYLHIQAWTFSIMRNTFINNYRKTSRNSAYFDNTADEFILYKNIDTKNVDPDSAYSEKEINNLIDNLGDESRVPFQMLLEGYSYEEIAAKLNLKEGTIKSRIFNTRKKLMDKLRDWK
jgi:RNA polymerase sigma factor (sigma-70 family)